MQRYVCIHGHFYQPPRENPWLERGRGPGLRRAVPRLERADHRRMLRPQRRARLLDGEGQIIKLLNNYAWISFNFGPTLLAWMAEHGARRAAGHRRGRPPSAASGCGGHGNALAQVYNHMIMPLASRRDKQTQVLWGIADFRHRFGREPEGMWLAETAVDLASLEVLAEAGIRFTILAPDQAQRWRKLGEKAWTEIPGGDRPVARLPAAGCPRAGRSRCSSTTAIISQQVAFERLLDSGERFLDRLFQAVRRRPRAAAAHAHRHRRRVVRPPPRPRRHGPGLRRSSTLEPGPRRPPDQLRRVPRTAPAASGRSRSTRTARGAASTASSAGGPTAAARCGRADWHAEVARPAARGARRARGAARPPLRARAAASASPTPGRRATPTST